MSLFKKENKKVEENKKTGDGYKFNSQFTWGRKRPLIRKAV